tara:strand:+ start:2626 stop:4008 length:1383 start_codon:yes stop_codon:yes gene_type:complete
MPDIFIYRKSKLEDGLRFEAEFYRPKYISNEYKHNNWKLIGSILKFSQYGLGFSLNEEGIGYPIFRLNEIENGFLTYPKKFVDINQEKYEEYKLKKNDILFCRTNGNFFLVGRAGILKEDLDAVFASYLVRIRPNSSHILPEFLNIYLNSSVGKLNIQRRAMQSNQTNVSAAQLKKIPIPIFDKKFQMKIKENFEVSSTKLTQAKNIYAEAEKIFYKSLGLDNWSPKENLYYVEKYQNIFKKKRIDAEHFHPKFKDMFNKISSKIKFNKIKNIAKFAKGVEPGSSNYVDVGIPFFRVSNITKFGLQENNIMFIRNEMYNNLKEDYNPKKGEILLSKDGTPGIAFYLKDSIEGIISGGLLRLHSIKNILPYYLEVVLNSKIVQYQMERDSGGSIIKHWKPDEISNTLIPRIGSTLENKISKLIMKSHDLRKESKDITNYLIDATDHAIFFGQEKAMKNYFR